MSTDRPDLTWLEDRDGFVRRHLGPRDADLPALAQAAGQPDLESLINAAVPPGIRTDGAFERLPEPASEAAVLARLRDLAAMNRPTRSYLGLGYHGTLTPPVIQRNILENPAWYTAYTPYQAEISQGRLEALLTFQSMVAELTAMPIANASLLDEGTAAAEAMTMCRRAVRGGGDRFLVDPDCHPQTIAIVQTRATALGIEVLVADPRAGELPEGIFGVLLQQPTSSGELHEDTSLIAAVHAAGAMAVVAADLLALVLVTPPGEQGADVVVGTTQRFGVPMLFGGPHAAYLATSDKHKRTMPGRIVGVSVDTKGRPAARLALQTREQHIRREKATSNICTSQVLLAVVAGMYAAWHGPQGLRRIANRVTRFTAILAAGAAQAGFELLNDTFFDTLALRSVGRADSVVAGALAAGYNIRLVDADTVAIALDETTTRDDVVALLEVLGASTDVDALDAEAASGIPTFLVRTSEFLTADVFHQVRSETDMLRHLRRLADKDLALDRTMIPLGSCTMKLNATTEMVSVTWPEFADMHPFAPLDQAAGTLALIHQLEDWLADITGYDRVSVQPNAGSQGEYAGLLAIRAYHDANGAESRDICLIPASAHGTNAASAVMAGMKVVVVDCDQDGNVDVQDLKAKVTEHGDDLAALMVTYPSTHGVFEETIAQVCALVHDHGGQVYLDGANLNALVGLARPGRFGSDVSHLNLHKTFCIPHGGGGPGVGPVGVRAHLAPFLPNHPLVPEAGPATGPGPVAAAPWGSAGILSISWAYVAMMGGSGLRKATEVAIANANAVAARLRDHYPVLYTGPGGLVAHEAIIDLRGIQSETGISNEDVAKRLIDYGFHAPTMSFPVAGTLMIEPTESESPAELDRFVAAMIAIRAEIDKVARGEWPADDNPLVNAPHPAEDLLGDWDHAYTREEAAYPLVSLRSDKYWVPVSRVDGTHGDRNLVCDCAPIDAYREMQSHADD
ncbi:MAG: glycine dehydrogenase [Glaciecola sp.]